MLTSRMAGNTVIQGPPDVALSTIPAISYYDSNAQIIRNNLKERYARIIAVNACNSGGDCDSSPPQSHTLALRCIR